MYATFHFDPRLLRLVEELVLDGAANDTAIETPVTDAQEAHLLLALHGVTNDAVARNLQLFLVRPGAAGAALAAGSSAANVPVICQHPVLIPPGFQLLLTASALTAGSALFVRAQRLRLRLPALTHDFSDMWVPPDISHGIIE